MEKRVTLAPVALRVFLNSSTTTSIMLPDDEICIHSIYRMEKQGRCSLEAWALTVEPFGLEPDLCDFSFAGDLLSGGFQ